MRWFTYDLRVSNASESPAESLRERKKRMTRQAIYDQAQRMFAERGYDAVTVAEIADAANISVKTLFTYIRAKEDLVFNEGPTLLDDLLTAVRNRPAGTAALDAVTATLHAATGRDPEGVEGYHRTVGNTAAVHARLRRMWDEFEVALAQALAEMDDTPLARADHRLEAAQLTTLVRLTTSQEVRTLIGGHSTIAAQEKAIRDWINHAATRMRNGLD